MRPDGAANPGQVQNWLGFDHYCSHDLPIQVKKPKRPSSVLKTEAYKAFCFCFVWDLSAFKNTAHGNLVKWNLLSLYPELRFWQQYSSYYQIFKTELLHGRYGQDSLQLPLPSQDLLCSQATDLGEQVFSSAHFLPVLGNIFRKIRNRICIVESGDRCLAKSSFRKCWKFRQGRRQKLKVKRI